MSGKRLDSETERTYTGEDLLETWLARAEGEGGALTLFGSTWFPEAQVVFARVQDIATYCDRVLTHIGCDRPVRVRRRRGNTAAHYEHGKATIAIPDESVGNGWAMRELTVLHEITHHLLDVGGHGPDFRARFVTLLREIGKPMDATLLQIAYDQAG